MSYVNDIAPRPYFPGQLVNTWNPNTHAATNQSGELVPFGCAVYLSAEIDGMNPGWELLNASTPLDSTIMQMGICTITQRVQGNTPFSVPSQLGIPPGAELLAVLNGPVAILSETYAITGAPVFVRFAVGSGGSQLGSIRNDNDPTGVGGSPTALKIAGWYFVEAIALPGTLGIINLK